MSTDIIKATHQGTLTINDKDISCAVLEGGIRVISERSISDALGAKASGSYWRKRKEGAMLPRYLYANFLLPYVSPELQTMLQGTITYVSVAGKKSVGLKADILPLICDVWIRAKEKGAIPENQLVVAQTAYSLLKGFATVGIIALVDEATGYQEVRDKAELRAFLKKFLLEEKTNYIDAYPDEFFEMMFKMRGLNWSKANKGKNPQYFGHYINNYVYSRLGPEVLYSLRKLSPKNEKGIRKTKLYNFTSPDYGFPKLKEHLSILIAFGKAAGYNWNNWIRLVERAFPKYSQDGSTAPELPFNDELT